MLKVPTDSILWINRGFNVLSDWAYQVSMEDTEIDKERGVITEEWRLGSRCRGANAAKIFSCHSERLQIC